MRSSSEREPRADGLNTTIVVENDSAIDALNMAILQKRTRQRQNQSRAKAWREEFKSGVALPEGLPKAPRCGNEDFGAVGGPLVLLHDGAAVHLPFLFVDAAARRTQEGLVEFDLVGATFKASVVDPGQQPSHISQSPVADENFLAVLHLLEGLGVVARLASVVVVRLVRVQMGPRSDLILTLASALAQTYRMFFELGKRHWVCSQGVVWV